MTYLACIETGSGVKLDPIRSHSAAPAEALRVRYDLERIRREVTQETIARGWIRTNEDVVLVSTGSGLKSIPTLAAPRFRTVTQADEIRI